MLEARGPQENAELREEESVAPHIGEHSTNSEVKPDASEVINAIEHDPAVHSAGQRSETANGMEELVAGSDEIDPSEANRPGFSVLPPDYSLLIDQLVCATPLHGWPSGSKVTQAREDGSVALYISLNPRNAEESVLARLIVGGTNAAMDCFALAGQNPQSDRARELNLKFGFKAADTVTNLIGMLQSHRAQGPQTVLVGTVNNVTVGEVTVEKGGQAIVGTIEGKQQKSIGLDSTPPQPTHRNEPSRF
jgi:hypothetical protein